MKTNTSAPLEYFLQNHCELGLEFREGKRDFYEAYKCHSLKTEQRPLSINEVGKWMTSKGFVEERTKETRLWRGVRVRPTEANNEIIIQDFHAPKRIGFSEPKIPNRPHRSNGNIISNTKDGEVERLRITNGETTFLDESAVHELLRRNMRGW